MLPKERAKDYIRQRFCRAAHSYDQYAHVQREAAAWLMECLATTPTTILEIGCGTGNLTGLLVERFPAAQIDALDFAESMVEEARRKLGNSVCGINFHCLDAEKFIRTTAKQYDLVISNATLQWFNDLPGTFSHLGRLLTADGMAVLSFFGPGSFQELAMAMREIVDPEISLPAEAFCSAQDAETLARHHFGQVELCTRLVQRQYATFFEILEHIKKTGTGGYHDKVPHLSRTVLNDLAQWFADRGGYAITYEIFTLCCQGTKGEIG